MSKPIRIALVDDQNLVREGIRSLLALCDDFVIVAECSDGNEALSALTEHEVDVMLLDLRMPRRDGIATLQAMRERGDEVPVLVLTTFDDDELVLGALQAGARGYLMKDVTLGQLVGGIRTLAEGGTLLQPALTDRLVRAIARPEPTNPPWYAPEPLSTRELEVLRLAASGWSNRQIAQGLYLAEGTIKNYMSSILLKLGVTDRTKAVLKALETGVLTREGDSDG